MLYGKISAPGRPDLANTARLDLLPVPALMSMMRYGIAIDTDYLRALSADLAGEMSELRADIVQIIPDQVLDSIIYGWQEDDAEGDLNPNSASQMADLLFSRLKLGSSRKLKQTKSGSRISTGKKQLETIKSEHPIVQKLLDYRERAKLKSTYADALPTIAVPHPAGYCTICEIEHKGPTSRIHTTFTTTRTSTGRLASKSPNLQNIPARTELGRRIRKAFIASPGMVLADRDFAQIELRLLAHCAREQAMIKIFKEGGDIHTDTACRAFGLPPKEIDKLLHRAPCKNVNFGICYGLQAPGLYDLMAVTFATAGQPMPGWLTSEWCQGFLDKWFGLYPAVRDFMAQEHYRARRYGVVWTLFGRIRRVPEVRSSLKWIEEAGLRQAGNHKIQGTAADIMKLAIASVYDRIRQYASGIGVQMLPLLTVHDELIYEVDEDWGGGADEIMRECMETVMVDERTGRSISRVPILSDGHLMSRWEK